MKILIADDDITSRKILESFLEKSGYEVISVNNGLEAWESLKNGNGPQLVILDWMMPGIDGMELCRKIRTLDSAIPAYIIMLTIKGGKNDIIQGLEAGANDYLTKPYDTGELKARISVGCKMISLETERANRIDVLESHEKKIKSLLEEKNLLLYEIHHRIKNNMNTVINMLTLQAEAIDDIDVVTILRNAVSRIKTMGILYDRLYRSETLLSMSVKEYLCALIDEIMHLFLDRYKISLDIDIEDFHLDVQTLSSVGIIINELVFNAMKYAFKGRGSGRISVAAHLSGSHVTIMVEDDGIGLPESASLENPEGFGLKLVKGFAAQIGGTMHAESDNGTRYILSFDIKTQKE